ncbi:hypothetical protein M413DRAFT_443793 [Hebeloma cylindrosporum]|uniref:CoA-transferase family III n=1 Tax=Hebeloma cylindrosporum TaxID=76867 RepID=A0A0C3C201_HEBCY|nr:hypothetical protein M413DRAFT_443793 [Hebeloma cylindrosporum h7]
MTMSSENVLGIYSALKLIWTSNDLPEEFLSHLKFTGNPDTSIPSSFRVGLAAQISIGLAGLSAAYLHYLRTGVAQDVVVDARHAVLSFHSEAWYTISDAVPADGTWDSIAGLYQTKDNGWVRIHTNFPHHRAGVLSILSISESPESQASRNDVAAAILRWDAQEFEDACAKRGMCAFKLRETAEWEKSDHAQALSNSPVVEIQTINDFPTKTLPAPDHYRPLHNVNVLDLSRVLAGPIAGRTLAAHGAQVLLVTSPNLPSLPLLDVETSIGKRTTQLDLDVLSSDKEKLRDLVKDADVFLQAYRPGGLESRGFGVDDVVKMKEGGGGVVYASLRAWGWDGPWANRRGLDSLVQTATGFNAEEGKAYQTFLKSQGKADAEWSPRPLPMQALDHAAGYFLAFGIHVALARMIKVGGSHEVRVSLAGVGRWIRSLGRLDPEQAFGPQTQPFPKRGWPLNEEIEKLSVVWSERWGKDRPNPDREGGNGYIGIRPKERKKMMTLRHAAILGVTPVREGVLGMDEGDWGAPMRLDADDPVWVRDDGSSNL